MLWPPAALAFCRRDRAVGHGSKWRADQRQEHWSQHVVPACAGHFPLAEHDIRQQKFQRHPGDVRDRRRHTHLQVLNGNFGEA
jgi:hypothetical protein